MNGRKNLADINETGSLIDMQIFHGSYCTIENPQIIKSLKTKDFGTGFYCTVIREQAERWAKRYDSRIVNCYKFLQNDDCRILEFREMTDEWLDFIVSSRSGKNHDFDIIIGPMADDQIYNYVSDFIEGNISRAQFWSLAKFKYPTNQICFCTKKSLNCIKYVCSFEVK